MPAASHHHRHFRQFRPSFPAASLAFFLAGVFAALPARADGDPVKGRQIAEQHCSRCHVVGAYNRLGGVNSTASFQMIIKMEDGLERFQTFYERRPHPVFVRVEGVPRWSNATPYAAEFKITLGDVDDIVAFAKTLLKVPIRQKGDRP